MRQSLVRAALGGLMALSAAPATAETLDNQIFTSVQIGQFEYRWGDQNVAAWEAEAWAGTDEHKLVIETEGEVETKTRRAEAAEVQLVYRRPVSDFFDLKAGVRHDFEPDPQRYYGVLGLEGLAPQWLELDTDLFVSEDGRLSARFEAEYEILLTQRLVLEPSVELNVALSGDRPIGIASGVTDTEIGLRLRYEINRDVAPYVGVHWERLYGRTADFAREEGEDSEDAFLLVGLRLMF